MHFDPRLSYLQIRDKFLVHKSWSHRDAAPTFQKCFWQRICTAKVSRCSNWHPSTKKNRKLRDATGWPQVKTLELWISPDMSYFVLSLQLYLRSSAVSTRVSPTFYKTRSNTVKTWALFLTIDDDIFRMQTLSQNLFLDVCPCLTFYGEKISNTCQHRTLYDLISWQGLSQWYLFYRRSNRLHLRRTTERQIWKKKVADL